MRIEAVGDIDPGWLEHHRGRPGVLLLGTRAEVRAVAALLYQEVDIGSEIDCGTPLPGGSATPLSEGLASLRDAIAREAMVVLASGLYQPDIVAERAYAIADAMLAERAKRS